MIGKLDEALEFQARALKLRGYRQQLLAANLANADTPQYKAVDFNFAEALKAAGAPAASALRASAPSHLPGVAPAPEGVRVQYRGATQPSIDGNSVDPDAERAQFADNAIRYEAAVRFLNGQIRTLMTAIKGE